MNKAQTVNSHLDVNHYAYLNLKYNPFSYLNDEELFSITSDRINLEKLVTKISTCKSCFVEFYGNKGRGKSTHLQLLHYKYFPEATFYKLKKTKTYAIKPIKNMLIIDSFQLLSLKNKLNLLQKQKQLIITSHYSHRFLSSKRGLNDSINFSKLDLKVNDLEKIIATRMELARLNKEKPIPKITQTFIGKLLKTHKNNLRQIQAELYQQLVNLNEDVYEL